MGVDGSGRLLVEGAIGLRDEDIAPEGDDDGVRGGFEGLGRRVPAGGHEQGSGGQNLE